jgi:predicted nucleic acid-binding protein
VQLASFRGEIDSAKRIFVLAQIEQDVQADVLMPVTVPWAAVYATAEKLTDAHSARLGCRSLDILHVAMAMELGVSEILTFDVRQQRLAKAAGLTTGP